MKKNYSFKKVAILFLLIANSFITNAQTNPVAQTLPYSQNFGTLASTATVYTTGFQGWNLSTGGSSTSFRTITPPASSDLALIASATAASTTGGIQNYNGKIGILSSSSVDPTLCLAINTTGVFNVAVVFDVMTIRNPFDGSANTRINQVDLQYRVGISGTFTSVSGITNGIYQNNTTNQITAVTTPQNSSTKTLTLPVACNNQSVIQLRWVQRDFSGVGSRPGFAFDNISICSTTLTPTISIAGPAAFCSGGTATYTATITNGGAAPSYQWKKNGVAISTSTPTPTISGLIVGDQITCTLTSNQTCVTSNVVTSNAITIGVVNSSPTISAANISNVSCPNAKNGAIDITVTGGTPPYTINWDTINTVNGAMFGVTVGTKTPSDPLFGLGNPNGYFIDGVEEKELFLTRGITYTFNVLTPGHPFHISTDNVGGNANFIVANGQSGAPTQSGTVTFQPSSSTPNLLYYPCQFHQFMGYKVNIGNGYNIEDLTNVKAGIYTVIVSDANGCTTTAQYTITELPSPITLQANVTDAICNSNTGGIDLTISGGVAPYTIIWDTINTTNGGLFGVTVGNKTSANPYFNMGNPDCFYIDGVETKILTMIKGITYTFNVFNPGHPWHISTDNIGGSTSGLVTNGQSGAPNDNGTVFFTPGNNISHPLHYVCANHQFMGGDINIVTGVNTEDLTNVHAGTYTVVVKDANGCLASAQYTVNATTIPFTVNTNITNSSCNAHTGEIHLTLDGGVEPYTILWDTINISNGGIFGVMVDVKTSSGPYYNIGNPTSFFIDGIESEELTLIRGIQYSFNIFNPGHPWHISTDYIGGNASNIVTSGQTGAPIDNGTVMFTPNASHPSLLYYVCANHQYMGYNINIIDGYAGGTDLTNLAPGIYSASITDANGCNNSLQFTVGQNTDCSLILNLKAFLQGLYIGNSTMQTVLFNDGVSSDPTASDSITVELHDGTDPNILVASSTVVLHDDGTAQILFDQSLLGGTYYIVVKNRNSIETWSKDPLLFDSVTISFDFTN